MWVRLGLVTVLFCSLVAMLHGFAWCAESPVESGKQALNGRTTFPWYDAEKDDLKRIDVTPAPNNQQSASQSNWQADPLSNRPANKGPAGPVGGGTGAGSVVNLLAWSLIFILLGILVVYLVQTFLNREIQGAIVTQSSVDDEPGGADRVENLPFQIAAPRNDFRSEAERLYRAGDFDGAIIYLFSYELLQLDKHHVIQLTRGKTNRQYWRECRTQPELASLLRITIGAFEDVFFGHHALSRERFENCWNGLEDFESKLRHLATVTV